MQNCNHSKPNILRTKLIYAKVLHSELTSFYVTAPTSLTWCRTQLAISVPSFLCLHKKYSVKVIASREIITEINMKMSTINFQKRHFCQCLFHVIMPFLQIKYFFIISVAVNKFF